MKKIITILLISLSLSLFSQENIDLFVWAGQSNAMGQQGDAAQYPADTDNLDNQIRFNWDVLNGSDSGLCTTMEPQDLGHYFTAGHFGPEVTFSRKLIHAGYNPAIFKYTQGATSIHEHWLAPGAGGMYDDMVTALNTAITALEAQGHTVTVRGFIWIQGESDSNTDARANAYNANLTNLINDFRNNVVSNATLPTILGVDEQFFDLTGHERHQILNAHQDLALNDATIKFTSMYGYPKGDVTHLTPAGVISHGEDLFDSYLLLISGQYPSESCMLTSTGNHTSFNRRSWGQSFTTDCSGTLANITFEAITTHADTATFTLYNGADCSGTVLTTQTLNNIAIGDNVVSFATDLYLEKEHTYYFDIVSDTSTAWGINFSDENDTNDVFGVLRCTSDDGTQDCGRTFLDYDMDFSVELEATQNATCTLAPAGSVVSFERASWGQSFTTACSGNLESITFDAATALNENATFTLYNGTDCDGAILFTQALTEIASGENIVVINNGLALNENNTYFFQVVTDNDTLWRIHYSNTSTVDGMLTCTSNDGTAYCGRTFPSYDMSFSVALGVPATPCADTANIYSFDYNGHTYEVVKENKTWLEAVGCAVARGGYLAEINDAAEQTAIFDELMNNAGITLTNTVSPGGGSASYVWLGGNDLNVGGTNNEGVWIWDGDNDGTSVQFWQGDTNGNPVGGLYTNWGTEPDNAYGTQDVLAIALTQWPVNSGNLGTAGQWNDLTDTNTLYYLIEHSSILTINETNNEETILVYPNPVNDYLKIENYKHVITDLTIYNALGQVIKTGNTLKDIELIQIDFSNYTKGTYFVKITNTNGKSITKKIIK